MGMPYKGDTPDAAIARIAASQHGVVTARQLAAAGFGRMAISERAKNGRLHRLHRGVYAVGHCAPTHHGRWMAAVLACGEGAVLSHHSAAALWELLRPIDGPVHVSVPTTAGRKPQHGIRLHRCPSLADPLSSPSSLPIRGGRGQGIITYRHRIPVTTIQRTIDDLDGNGRPLPPATRQASSRAETRPPQRRRGNPLTLGLEEDFYELLRRHHHLPPPETNVKIGRWEVDFLWREKNVVVETDSFTYHQGSIAYEDDHARELDLRQQGFTVLRFTDLQIENEPDRVVADVARALSA